MQKKWHYGAKLLFGLIAISFFSFTGGSCGQHLKYITLDPLNPTISTPGTVLAVQTGGVNVTAYLGSIAGSSPLTISSATLQSIMVTPANPILPIGLSQSFSATGTYTDGSIHDVSSLVTWSSSAPVIAPVDPNIGAATAAQTGAATITASIGSISGSAVLSVNGAIVLTAVSVSASTTLPVGLTQQFSVTGTFSDSTVRDVTPFVSWTVTGSTSQTVVTISPTGLATTFSPGSATISASLAGSNIPNPNNVPPGTTTLQVSTATLQSIAVSTPSGLSIPNGRSIQFTAMGAYSDATTHDITSLVTWSAGTPTVAFVNIYGLAYAIGPAYATSAITATLGTVSQSAILTISPLTLQSITVTPYGITIPVGSVQKFTATVNYSDGSNYDVTSQVSWTTGNATNPIATMYTGLVQQFHAYGTYNGGTTDISSLTTWTSSNPSVANVYNFGYALAFGSGATLITATLDGVSASTPLNVSPVVSLKSITITPANLTLPAGASQQFTATGNYYDGSSNNLNLYVTWNSDNPAVSFANINGVVTGIAGGTSHITASVGSFVGSTVLTVSP
ncbi:MAG: Ig domain-containing protein [Nitrospiria bacterium]